MPKLRHEAVVEVLQNEPLLVPLLLAYAGDRQRVREEWGHLIRRALDGLRTA
jgi:hypothetical protein